MVMWGQRMNALVKMGYNALAGYGTMRLCPHRNAGSRTIKVSADEVIRRLFAEMAHCE